MGRGMVSLAPRTVDRVRAARMHQQEGAALFGSTAQRRSEFPDVHCLHESDAKFRHRGRSPHQVIARVRPAATDLQHKSGRRHFVR